MNFTRKDPLNTTPSFRIIPGDVVGTILRDGHEEVLSVVERAYRTHGAGNSVNPPSYFLRFADRPDSRIIALPASLGADFNVDGIKWISSFPANVSAGLPRASAVLILNDHDTGYPFACLESSIISATRTAASAALAASVLHRSRERPRTISYFGTGLIARYVHQWLLTTGWEFDAVTVYDSDPSYAQQFANHVREGSTTAKVVVEVIPERAVRDSGLIVFATTASKPHVTDEKWFSHAPTVLHLSLRDLSAEVILSATNVVDDVEHCLKAETSPHLAEKMSGHRDFIDATLPDLLNGQILTPAGGPVIFSPFGLGVLDLAVGLHVYSEAVRRGLSMQVPNFFSELKRYG